jgi:PIN domain nuclease of toxin-antitoxin system
VDVVTRREGARPQVRVAAAQAVILLDTNAVIWLAQGHRRATALARVPRLYLSPATVLELQFLVEVGRLQLARGHSAVSVSDDPRWVLDEPPSGKWFDAAADLAWTRDPFDRLIVAHARLRGWRLATADTTLLDHLSRTEGLPL